MQRSRRCVQEVLSKLAISKVCNNKAQELDLGVVDLLDNCYEEDLKQRFRRELLQQNSKIVNGSSDDWEYWSLKDSVLFCFTGLYKIRIILTFKLENNVLEKNYKQVFIKIDSFK